MQQVASGKEPAGDRAEREEEQRHGNQEAELKNRVRVWRSSPQNRILPSIPLPLALSMQLKSLQQSFESKMNPDDVKDTARPATTARVIRPTASPTRSSQPVRPCLRRAGRSGCRPDRLLLLFRTEQEPLPDDMHDLRAEVAPSLADVLATSADHAAVFASSQVCSEPAAKCPFPTRNPSAPPIPARCRSCCHVWPKRPRMLPSGASPSCWACWAGSGVRLRSPRRPRGTCHSCIAPRSSRRHRQAHGLAALPVLLTPVLIMDGRSVEHRTPTLVSTAHEPRLADSSPAALLPGRCCGLLARLKWWPWHSRHGRGGTCRTPAGSGSWQPPWHCCRVRERKGAKAPNEKAIGCTAGKAAALGTLPGVRSAVDPAVAHTVSLQRCLAASVELVDRAGGDCIQEVADMLTEKAGCSPTLVVEVLGRMEMQPQSRRLVARQASRSFRGI